MNQPIRHPLQAEQTDYGARFTAAEFVGMAASGAFDDMNVELLGGELERMNPPMSIHGRVQADLGFELRVATTDVSGISIFAEVGILLDEGNVVSCDAAIARIDPSDNRLLRPEDLILVVEVASTTLAKDIGPKRLAYAAAAIPHYWVVDPERQVTHVYGEPVSGDYADISTVRFGAPLAVPGSERTITLG